MFGVYRASIAWQAVRKLWLGRVAERNVGCFPFIKRKRHHALDAPLTISLTSYPPRFQQLEKTIRSLIDQTLMVDNLVLWISRKDQFALPAELLELRKYNLSIRVCDDILSYKKLVPSLMAFEGHYVVTADDDVYYPPRWLESLVAVAAENKRSVIGGRVHMGKFNCDGSMAPYGNWELATIKRSPPTDRHFIFPTGVGGILYPPRLFDSEVLNETRFMRLCPRGDDIWFFWMARRAGVRHLRAKSWFDVVEWPTTQDIALFNDNLYGAGNDQQIKAMESEYGFLGENLDR